MTQKLFPLIQTAIKKGDGNGRLRTIEDKINHLEFKVDQVETKINQLLIEAAVHKGLDQQLLQTLIKVQKKP